jgi:hypothetical protein
MAENFNVDPYYDDFDPSKNFHRILFKPGYAVQARELTQSQTILQNQISKFADNIFTQNTPVTGGRVTTNLNCYYLKLNSVDTNNNPIVAASFLNKVLKDSTGTILAKVIAVSEGTDTEKPTLIVNYLSGVKFGDSTTLTPTDGSNLNATTIGAIGGTTCTGLSSVASISDGVFYVVNGYSRSSTQNEDGSFTKYSIGNFVSVQPQTVILDKYSNKPSYRVGLEIKESIVDNISDSSLLDPAVGASNYQAPGSDRYQITLTLVSLPLTLGNDDQFIELMRVENGNILKQVDGTVYSVIDDYFAKRDYETNGDYIVEDFKLTPVANTVNTSTYDLKVGKGIAYVRGYRIENQSDVLINNEKSRSTDSVNNNAVYIDYGSYLHANNIHGTFDVTTSPIVDLHCVPATQISTSSPEDYKTTVIGTAFVRNLSYDSSPTNNVDDIDFKLYLSDITTRTIEGKVSSYTGVANEINIGMTNPVSMVPMTYIGATITITSGASQGDVRKITNYDGMNATVDSDFTNMIQPTDTFRLGFTSKNINSVVKADAFSQIEATADVTVSSKVNYLQTGDTIIQSPNDPELIWPIGYPYVSSVSNSNYFSTKVFRAKPFSNIAGIPTLTLSIPSGSPLKFLGTGDLSSDAVKQNFIVIDKTSGGGFSSHIVDATETGCLVSVSLDHSTVTFSGVPFAGKIVDIIASVSISNADNTDYVLKSKNLIKGNTSIVTAISNGTIVNNNYIDLTKGQILISHDNVFLNPKNISLYTTDIKKIVKIVDTKDPDVDPTPEMLVESRYDVTNLFTFDNGQRDTYYDHGYISLISGAAAPKGKLLVIYDYYSHSGGDGYFNLQSYLSPVSYSPENYEEIGSFTAKNGDFYKLTDSVDFRPSRQNATATFKYEYTGDPSLDDTGVLIPNNLSEYVHDYTYYLARKDKLVLTKDKNFKIIKGTPSINPVLPTEPDGALVLANISHDPYTSYIPGQSKGLNTTNLSIDKILHKRWAKSDITKLQTRVDNLEYYSSLSLLEQNAQSLQIPDVNGLNRFKNGILVDDFSSFSTADTSNADFASNINTRTKQLTPLNLVNNYQLQNPAVLNSLGTLKQTNTYAVSSVSGTQTNIFTLPYTTANVVIQPLATSTVSVNPFAVAVYQGVSKLNPPMDNWVDNSQAPALIISDPSMQIYQQTNGVNLTNAGDFATIPGTESVTSSTSRSGRTVTTVTNTYASQLQNISTTSGYSPISSTFGINNGYITNIAVLPYIRPQQIIVKSKGMLVNSPVKTWFDGVSVDQYMVSPNIVELTNVTGSFKEDDVVGFYAASLGEFVPVARVISTYHYPNSTNVRLYVAKMLNSALTYGSTELKNATFNADGAYTGSTATGTIPASAIIALHTSGAISGVGGSYTANGSATPLQFYKSPNNGSYCSFLNQYGIWGDSNNGGSYSATFTVDFPTAGSYTFISSVDDTAVVRLNGTQILSVPGFGTTYSTTYNVTSAGPHEISWTATNSGGPAAFALVVQDSTGKNIFTTITPPNLTYTNITSEIVMPHGGAWFTGVTKVKLDASAAANNNFYAGAKINITSKYVYDITLAATYTPPPAPSGGGGGHCCVIATALTDAGEWTPKEKMKLVQWSINKLDKSFLGDRLHRGYHIIAPKLVPIFFNKNNKVLRSYAKWSFGNATRMLQGKKFDLLSIPNSAVWMISMLTVGLFVSKETATKSWNALYKNKK